MAAMAVTIHGAGCALMDYLYRGVDFHSPAVQDILQRSPGDGGLIIGGLVFAEALERFAGRDAESLIRRLSNGRSADEQNVGGPAIVSLIHTAQLLPQADVRFYGAVGDDEAGRSLRSIVGMSPLITDDLRSRAGATPATYVFSDPDYAGGNGERLFVNRLGVAAKISADDLGAHFPEADIVQLGGTALVPRVHDALPEILERARSEGALTVVNTVYDFRSQAQSPGERWTLGDDGAYPLIDLLIADAEEARHLSATAGSAEAIAWFLDRGVEAAVVTNGPEPAWFGASGRRFASVTPSSLPVFTRYARTPEVRAAAGDTTGCGDNFTGGLVAQLAEQIERSGSRSRLDLRQAVQLGIASGAFCLTHLGGFYREPAPGEKRRLVYDVLDRYLAEAKRS